MSERPIVPSDSIFVDEILQAVNELMEYSPKSNEFVFMTAGTGIPDEFAVDFYKDTNQLAMTRDGRMWRRGEIVDDSRTDEA